MIVLWGLPEDPPLFAVANALSQRDANYAFLDQAFVDHMTFDHVGREMTIGTRRIALAEINALYLRPYDVCEIPGFDPDDEIRAQVDRIQSTLMELASTTRGIVLNRPQSPHLNHSKPAQLQRISELTDGVSVPQTLVTTCGHAVSEFVEQHGRCIVKSVSGVRSRVRIIEPGDLNDERLATVQYCPVQVQEWIPGTDIRVHVVGEQTFATQVASDADDYRYEQASLLAIKLPESIERSCLQVARGMDLHLSGIDLRRTPGGEWYCFEANPSPAFTYYEVRTKQPIAGAIAELLMSEQDCNHNLLDTGGGEIGGLADSP